MHRALVASLMAAASLLPATAEARAVVSVQPFLGKSVLVFELDARQMRTLYEKLDLPLKIDETHSASEWSVVKSLSSIHDKKRKNAHLAVILSKRYSSLSVPADKAKLHGEVVMYDGVADDALVWTQYAKKAKQYELSFYNGSSTKDGCTDSDRECDPALVMYRAMQAPVESLPKPELGKGAAELRKTLILPGENAGDPAVALICSVFVRDTGGIIRSKRNSIAGSCTFIVPHERVPWDPSKKVGKPIDSSKILDAFSPF